MIWLDNRDRAIRLQWSNEEYCKLNDGSKTFKYYYGPDKLTAFIKAGMLVEWNDD